MIKSKQLESTLGSEDAAFTAVYSDNFIGDLDGAIRFLAKNESGATINKGSAIYVSGISTNAKPLISLANASSQNSMPAFGLAYEDITNNSVGEIVTFGNLINYDTTNYNLTVGSTVYVSAATSGALTTTPPSGEGNLIQNIGSVVRAHDSSGVIKVSGAGRSAATPNLNEDKLFIGNSSNQTTTVALADLPISTSQITGLNDVATTGSYTDLSDKPDLSIYSPLASPAFTGTPTAVTPTAGTNTTQLATTAFVNTALSAGGGGLSNIVEDTSPQLGGNLSMNGFKFTTDIKPDSVLRDLGDSNSPWGKLYLKENGKIYFGADQDVELIHDPNDGLILDLGVADGSNDPQFMLRSQTGSSIGPKLAFLTESPSPAYNDIVGSIEFSGRDSADNFQEYASIKTRIISTTSGSETGRISILPHPSSINNRGLHVEATSVTEVKVNIDHNTGYGLHLNNVLVTSKATELNLLDGDTTVGSSISIADTDGFIVNDNGVSKLIPASDLKSYTNSTGFTYSAISSSTTAQISHHYSCTGSFTLTIPTSQPAGSEIRVKNMGTGTITLNPQTSNIDGSSANHTIDVQFDSITLVSDGTGWEIV